MDGSGISSLNVWPRLKNIRRVAFFICFVSIVASLVWYSPRIDFAILRLKTKASFVVIRVSGEKEAFSLNEKQTKELLSVIDHRTHPTTWRKAVLYDDWIDIYCKNDRGVCLHRFFVHQAYDTESMDVLEELFRIAREGIRESFDSGNGACDTIPANEREY